jgi:two-component system response regulator PilR (NtrC family)
MRILLLDDDAGLRAELATFLRFEGRDVLESSDLAGATRLLAQGGIDLVLADLMLGAERGTELLARPLPAGGRLPPVVMISGHAGIPEAVAALKAGARDFLEKPVDRERLRALLRGLDRELQAERRLSSLQDEWLAEHAAFAPGSPFARAVELARELAASPLAVLLAGPSGSGKEVVARWIHRCSPRSAGPFVAVNCAAVPEELADTAFFGARRGAYTGADADREGYFQAARGGTLFLDEVGELPASLQAKLLRAVEGGEVQRVGSTSPERADLRLLAASNRDLAAMAAAGSFREDLRWRLAQVVIELPGLAGRKEDIGPLARFFLQRLRGGLFPEAPELSAQGLAWLEERPWPGNARELRAFLERAAWLAGGGSLGRAELLRAEEAAAGRGAARQAGEGGEAADEGTAAGAAGAREAATIGAAGDSGSGLDAAGAGLGSGKLLPLREAKLAFERAYVERVLAESDGSVRSAAEILGLLPNNLSRKLGELGIVPPARR